MIAGGFDLFAITSPGLEPLVERELRALGCADAAALPGGVTFTGDADTIAQANLHLRAASRVVARAGAFHARALGELERRARLLPWERFIGRGRAIRIRATCRKSRLYHEKAVAERIAGAIVAATGAEIVPSAALPDDEADGAAGELAQLVLVRMLHDECTVSIDSSGALLHRRGYRTSTAKAPLRETLAAALLLLSEWPTHLPLLDPLCGSGTIPIEGALIARRIPPGLHRRFAFLEWPVVDAARWPHHIAGAREQILPAAPAPIHGSDRDAGAIAAALANAERAGVAADIVFRRAAISAAEPAGRGGWLVSNPPYGRRIGAGTGGDLRDLYAQLGHLARRRLSGWHVTLLLPAAPLERAVGLAFRELARTTNGGLGVRMVQAVVPGPADDG